MFVSRFWKSFSLLTMIAVEVGFCLLARACKVFQAKYGPEDLVTIDLKRLELEQSFIFAIGYRSVKSLLYRTLQTGGILLTAAVTDMQLPDGACTC